MSVRDLAAALLLGQQAVQLESGPPVHEHRRRIRGGIGHQQPGGPALVHQRGELRRAVLADREQRHVVADRRPVHRRTDQ
jgi:hypothetical protein